MKLIDSYPLPKIEQVAQNNLVYFQTQSGHFVPFEDNLAHRNLARPLRAIGMEKAIEEFDTLSIRDRQQKWDKFVKDYELESFLN